MKRMDIFCSSPSSTAICSSLDHRSMVRRGTRPIDHHHNSRTYANCSSSSQLPTNSNPNYFQKSRKSTSSSSSSSVKQRDLRRKSSADISDVRTPTGSSSRHLLSDKVPYIDWISESDALVLDTNNRHSKARHASSHNTPRSCSLAYYAHDDLILENDHVATTNSRPSTSNISPTFKTSASARSRDQVVVLWVSIHCKGCEGKVRKHISKMEGVTSYSIDLATKKVTVIGNVTPLGVLACVSEVKNAQFWPYPSSSTPSRWST